MFHATAHLGRTEREAWVMPMGWLLDQIECYLQFEGIRKPKTETFVEDIFREGVR